MLQSISYPTFLISQTTNPGTDFMNGALWYKSDTKVLYSFDGATWNLVVPVVTDTSSKGISAQAINVLKTKSSQTLIEPPEIFIDTFSDSDGYLNTISGSTTARFDTNNYTDMDSAIVTETNAHGVNLTDSNSHSVNGGFKFHTNSACELVSVAKHASCTATRAQLLDSAKAVVASATFVGNTATFSPVQSLTTATDYYVVADNSGSDYTSYHVQSGYSYPYNDTIVNITAGLVDNGAYGGVINLLSVSTQIPAVYNNRIIQTNALTIPASAIAAMVYSNTTTSGTGSVTFDLSTDNGAHYQTAQALNTKITLTNVGTQAILKLNLNKGASNGLALAYDYGLLFFY